MGYTKQVYQCASMQFTRAHEQKGENLKYCINVNVNICVFKFDNFTTVVNEKIIFHLFCVIK